MTHDPSDPSFACMPDGYPFTHCTNFLIFKCIFGVKKFKELSSVILRNGFSSHDEESQGKQILRLCQSDHCRTECQKWILNTLFASRIPFLQKGNWCGILPCKHQSQANIGVDGYSISSDNTKTGGDL